MDTVQPQPPLCCELPTEIWRRVAELRPSVARLLARVVLHLGLRHICAVALQRAWRCSFLARGGERRLPLFEPVFFGAEDGEGAELGRSHRSLCFDHPYCPGYREFAFLAFSKPLDRSADHWRLEVVLQDQAQHDDAFAVGLYPTDGLGELSLSDLWSLKAANDAQFAPNALEAEPDPTDLAFDRLASLEHLGVARVVHSHEIMAWSASQLRDFSGAGGCTRIRCEAGLSERAMPTGEAPLVDVSFSLVFGEGASKVEYEQTWPMPRAAAYRLVLAGSYDGISARFVAKRPAGQSGLPLGPHLPAEVG